MGPIYTPVQVCDKYKLNFHLCVKNNNKVLRHKTTKYRIFMKIT